MDLGIKFGDRFLIYFFNSVGDAIVFRQAPIIYQRLSQCFNGNDRFLSQEEVTLIVALKQ